MTPAEITAIFGRFASLKIGVIGDFALDLYFNLQTRTGEQSLETGHDVFWGSRPTASLGAAGNVVQNLVALGVADVRVIGCIGDDLFGREMRQLLGNLAVNTQHLHWIPQYWDTCVYAKPTTGGVETNRIDFGTANELTETLFTHVLTSVERQLAELDVLIINQQFANPLLTAERTQILNQLMVRFPAVQYVADMRDVGNMVRGATLKVNTSELANFLGVAIPQHPTLDWCLQHGNAFRVHNRGPLLITRGHAGILHLDDFGAEQIDGLPLPGEVDTVGAGDTVVASWAASVGAGASPKQALTIANLAAAVTVQKLAQTGTATLTEILAMQTQYSIHD